MFLEYLQISNKEQTIRTIKFVKGLNLIIDETPDGETRKPGNNIGKTTVLRLIDYCLGDNGKDIYQDPEFPTQINEKVESFLKTNRILLTLSLIANIDDLSSERIVIKRNFYDRPRYRILEINGEKILNKDFDACLNKLIFNFSGDKPTFNQIIAKNIRYSGRRMENTIKVIDQNTTKEQYEVLYLFLFGINSDISYEKQLISEEIKSEETILRRLEKDRLESASRETLELLNKDIQKLELKKQGLLNSESYVEDIHELDNIRTQLNQASNTLGQKLIRKNLIIESKEELEKSISTIDTDFVKQLYKQAQSFIPSLHDKFNELVEFHNLMTKNKMAYITKELPELEADVAELKAKCSLLSSREHELATTLTKAGLFDDYENIIHKLNEMYVDKGHLEEIISQFEYSRNKLHSLHNDLEDVKKQNLEPEGNLHIRITKFNEFFSKLTEQLYGHRYILHAEKNNRAIDLHISSVSKNPGSGVKKTQNAAFDLAYIQFCDFYKLPCLHFTLYDQIELIDDMWISSIAEIAKSINCQFVAPILSDKFPDNMNVNDYQILSLSQNNKLLKI